MAGNWSKNGDRSASIGSSIDTIHERMDILSTKISLLQLVTLGKITPEEMKNLLKMLFSPDKENHAVAHETIKNLLKTILDDN
jgi:polyhydroxyalkanoate synthesis regulator phasin